MVKTSQSNRNLTFTKMREARLFIGCKVIKAEPVSEFTFINLVKNESVPQDKEDREGYLVEYPDGYKSWSPKEVFENAYRFVTPDELKLINE